MHSKKAKRTVIIFILFVVCAFYAMLLHWFLTDILPVPFHIMVLILLACLSLYTASVTLWLRNKKKRNELITVSEFISYLLAAGVMPSIVLFHYVSLNAVNFIILDCIRFAAILALFSISVFLLLSYKGDRVLSLALLLLIWFLFWVYPYAKVNYPNQTVLLALVSVIFGTVGYCLFHIHFDKTIGITLIAVTCLLFLYNFGSAIYHTIHLLRMNEDRYQTKSSFIVDDDSQRHPDVYWLHMDGMMGFSETGELFDDDQTELKDCLSDRGFVVNEKANLNIGWTAFALPGLTSPSIYDNYMHDRLMDMSNINGAERKAALGDEAYSIYNIYPKLELFNAFLDNNYTVYYVVYDIGRGMERVPTDYLFSNAYELGKKAGIAELLSKYSLLSVFEGSLSEIINIHSGISNYEGRVDPNTIPYVNSNSNFSFNSIEHYDWVSAAMFEQTVKKDSPKLVYFQNLLPHFPFKYDENGIDHGGGVIYDMRMYMPQQKYASKVMLGMTDEILESNQDAVIIIQADHGVHGLNSRAELEKQGYSNEEILAMNFSTISAVRIPEKYGSLTEPLDPLDITRYLVNHFVGKGNYEYLYYKGE